MIFERGEIMSKSIIGHKKTVTTERKRYICLDLEMCELTSKQRKGLKGLWGEVIQIGAVMLDENFTFISEFSSFVKPIYGSISDGIAALTGITNNHVANADTFDTAFYKFFTWVGDEDVTTFCWSVSDYKQLWDEVYIKAKNHNEYREFLRTFVDLQAFFVKTIGAGQLLSLDTALKFCHLKFKGQRHSAIFDAYNTARILFKLTNNKEHENKWNYIASYTETEMSKRYFRINSFDKDYTASFASFVSPEVLERLGYSEEILKKQEEKNYYTEKNYNQPLFKKKFWSKFFICTRYGIKVSEYLKFSIKMRFTRDLKMPKPVNVLTG